MIASARRVNERPGKGETGSRSATGDRVRISAERTLVGPRTRRMVKRWRKALSEGQRLAAGELETDTCSATGSALLRAADGLGRTFPCTGQGALQWPAGICRQTAAGMSAGSAAVNVIV